MREVDELFEVEAGFFVTADELKGRFDALDAQIQQLDRQIIASAAPTVDLRFKQAWRDFVNRWALVRGQWSSFSSRFWTGSRAQYYLQDWEAGWRRWLHAFQERSAATAANPGAQPAESYSLADAARQAGVTPFQPVRSPATSWVWPLALGAVLGAFALMAVRR